MKRRLISLAMFAVIVLNAGIVPVTAQNSPRQLECEIMQEPSDNFAQQLTLIQGSNGSFQISDSLHPVDKAVSSIRVTAIEGSDVYCDDKNDCFMRVSEDRFIAADRISINPYSLDDLEDVIDQYDIQKAAQDDLRQYMQRVSNGLIVPDEDIKIYVPVENKSSDVRSESTVTRTYTGYNNRQYYEELIIFSGNSLSFNVAVPNSGLNVYANNVLTATAKTTLGYFANKVSGGTWTLLSVFFQSSGSSSIPTTTAYKHTAVLMENKYRKYTYVIQGGEYYIGSVLDYAHSYRFKNYLNVPGYNVYEDGMTPWQSSMVNGYFDADKLAFQNYLYYSYVDKISCYCYQNTSAGITTYVDSLI